MAIYSINQIKERITPVAQSHGVGRIKLFGSYARGEATEESDIDLHVWCRNLKSLLNLGGFMADLKDALGKEVDVVPHDGMKKKFYEAIRGEEVLLYGEV